MNHTGTLYIFGQKHKSKHFQFFYGNLDQNTVKVYKIMLKSHTQIIVLIFNYTTNFI